MGTGFFPRVKRTGRDTEPPAASIGGGNLEQSYTPSLGVNRKKITFRRAKQRTNRATEMRLLNSAAILTILCKDWQVQVTGWQGLVWCLGRRLRRIWGGRGGRVCGFYRSIGPEGGGNFVLMGV